MRGIILAAGKGARLNGLVGSDPKCLLKVGPLTLIERQVEALRAEGIDDITAVIGAGADRVRQVCGPGLRFIENKIFDRTNSLYSLWLVRHLLLDGFVVMNSDVLFHPLLLKDLLAVRYEDALLVSYSNEPDEHLGDEEMKVIVRRGLVADISKSIAPRDADGENVGVVKFGSSGASMLVREMDDLISNGGLHEWAPSAFRLFALRRPLHAIGTRGYPWIEIDFPEDYRRAISDVLPLIVNQSVIPMSIPAFRANGTYPTV